MLSLPALAILSTLWILSSLSPLSSLKKYVLLTYLLTDNLKARDASAYKKPLWVGVSRWPVEWMWLQGDLNPMTRVDAWCFSTCQREFLPKSTSDPHWDKCRPDFYTVPKLFDWGDQAFWTEGNELSKQYPFLWLCDWMWWCILLYLESLLKMANYDIDLFIFNVQCSLHINLEFCNFERILEVQIKW